MEFRILDKNMQAHAIIDSFESVIWTARVGDAGDFELYTPVTPTILEEIQLGFYFFSDLFYDEVNDKAMLMFIETITIESDAEKGAKIKVTGRDLKTILDRRIVWEQASFKASTDNVKDVIKKLLTDSIINPQDWSKSYQDGDTGQTITIQELGANRKINNFVFIDEDYTYPTLTEDVQYDQNYVFDAITDLCNKYKLVYNVLYNFTTGNFEFHLAPYRDRTYTQYANSPVLFSSAFENLKSSNYISSKSVERTVGLVVGEGDEYNRMYNLVGGGSGLDRKELPVNASDISRTLEDGTEYGNATYLSMLKDKGEKELLENKYIETYEGEVVVGEDFTYPGSFDIGDIVEIINEYEISAKVLISEIVLSISEKGYSVAPTFSVYSEEENEEGGE